MVLPLSYVLRCWASWTLSDSLSIAINFLPNFEAVFKSRDFFEKDSSSKLWFFDPTIQELFKLWFKSPTLRLLRKLAEFKPETKKLNFQAKLLHIFCFMIIAQGVPEIQVVIDKLSQFRIWHKVKSSSLSSQFYKPELELLEFEVDDKACDKWSKDASELMVLSKSPWDLLRVLFLQQSFL